MFRNIMLGVASAAVLAVAIPAAQAADLPAYEPAPVVAVPSFTWTGPYIGAQAGYSWGHAVRTKPDGWTVGGFLGYNYQLDASPVVVGLETDFNYADIDDRRGRTRVSSDWNGATRARLGYAFDRFLVYGAGGLAYSDREVKRGADGDNKSAIGYTVGGGVEYAASDNLTVRAEYRFDDYGKDRFNGAKSSYSDQRVLGGVAYKFTSPF